MTEPLVAPVDPIEEAIAKIEEPGGGEPEPAPIPIPVLVAPAIPDPDIPAWGQKLQATLNTLLKVHDDDQAKAEGERKSRRETYKSSRTAEEKRAVDAKAEARKRKSGAHLFRE